MTPKTRYRTLMLLPIVVVLINAWVASHALAKLFDSQRWLAHTLETITQSQEMRVSMSSANNAARAYLLTGKPEYEVRFTSGEQDVYRDLGAMATLTGDNRSQQDRVPIVRQRIQVKLGALEAAIAQKHAHPHEPISAEALLPVLSDSPDGGISVKYAILQMQEEERRLLDQRAEEARAARRNVVATFSAATVLDLVLLVFAFQLLIKTSRDQEQLANRATEIETLNGELSGLNADLEQRVQQRTRELEESNQELQAFSYSVSHDLRAPLRTIDGFSLALAEDFADVLNEDGRDYIQRVRGGVQRMGMLIDALLQLSRVTRSEVQRERVDLSQLARLTFGELVTNDAEREVAFAAQPDMVAEADPRLMRVAFENLLGNALKFTSRTAGARIDFGSTVQNGETVYFIRDNGAGFDMQYVDRLFTAFQRLHGDREFKGSGIGLATVSRIIRRHQGRIWAEGKVGAGATFFFTLQS